MLSRILEALKVIVPAVVAIVSAVVGYFSPETTAIIGFVASLIFVLVCCLYLDNQKELQSGFAKIGIFCGIVGAV